MPQLLRLLGRLADAVELGQNVLAEVKRARTLKQTEHHEYMRKWVSYTCFRSGDPL